MFSTLAPSKMTVLYYKASACKPYKICRYYQFSLFQSEKLLFADYL